MSLQNREIINSNYQKLNNGDFAGWLADISEDASNHGEKVGRTGFAMVLEDIYQTFPDFSFEIVDLAAEGDSVVVRTMVKGTHLGTGQISINGGMLVGVEPTGRSFTVEHIHWYKLRDGKIVEHYATRDDIGMMQQLGLLPATVMSPISVN